MNNVHRLFNTSPEQRAIDCLMRVRNGQADVRSGWLGYGAALNEIKAQYGGNDKAFGKAVAAAGLDKWPENVPSQAGTVEIKRDIRAAAMWAAALKPEELEALEAAHPKLHATELGGFRGLHAKANAPKKSENKTVQDDVSASKHGTPILDKAREAVRDLVREGKPVNARKMEKEIGISHVTIESAVACERAYIEGLSAGRAEAGVDAISLSATAQERLEAAKRQALKKMEVEFQTVVEDEVTRYITDVLKPQYQANLDHADAIARSHRGVMTKAEYNAILSCLHPDSRESVSSEKLADAFRAFRSKEIPLLPGDATAPPPRRQLTREEMIAKRREMKNKRSKASA